ncbi:helix-turn-helix domain-containing protein [Chitinimonas arctica]|uniref:Helix-turn-helix domain-containing protein n=1 Tax=Chitinimonas arctica TaxID=2594795 RepID=A0A516SJP0_9NEIS|nr:helix-turn-helix domain-containing protein [Chitinimonas arctica]
MRTYTLEQAAALAQCHPETLRHKIKASEAPGRKVGRAYVILETDLAAYLRGDYIPGARQATAHRDTPSCRFTSKRNPETGTLGLSHQTALTLDTLLAQPTRSRRVSTTTG